MDQNMNITLTLEELDLLLHFARIGQNYCYVRSNYGDRTVAAELDPVLMSISRQLLEGVV